LFVIDLLPSFLLFIMPKEKERDSNVEILRLVGTISILLDHFVGQTKMYEKDTFLHSLFYCFCMSLSRPLTSIFIIISAWFGYGKPFRFQKVAHVWLTCAMFTIPFMSYLYFYVGEIKLSTFRIGFLPVTESPLWFVSAYIMIMMLKPMIDISVQKCSKKVLKMILLFLFFVQVVFSTITAQVGPLGGPVFCFISIFLLVGYLRKYHDGWIPSLKASLITFLTFWLTRTVFHAFIWRMEKSPMKTALEKYVDFYRYAFPSLPHLITAFSLFFVFLNIKIPPSKLFNKMASTSLGVYCFHQVPDWSKYMWKNPNLFNCMMYRKNVFGIARAFYVFRSVIILWCVGSILETFRAKIAAVLIEERAWFKKFCRYINHFFNGEKYELEPEKNRDNKKEAELIAFCSVLLIFYYVFIVNIEMVDSVQSNSDEKT